MSSCDYRQPTPSRDTDTHLTQVLTPNPVPGPIYSHPVRSLRDFYLY